MDKKQIITYAREKGIRAASRKSGVARSTIGGWLKKSPEYNEKTETKDTLSINSKSFDIRTLDDLIRYSEIDIDIWEPVKVTTNKWETGKRMLYQIKADFRKRVVIEDAKQILQRIVDESSKKAPKVQAIKRQKTSDVMLDLSIADHHFGKLSWGKQTGDSYNVDIAKDTYLKASEYLLSMSPDVDQILYIVGNDLLHCDNAINRTHSGNPLDSDTRWERVYLTAFEAIKNSIVMAREKAPVDVVIVPGNHDMEKTFCLGHSLQCYFHNYGDVNVNNSPSPRKYYRYGTNLIGMTHGSEEAHKDLPLIMAQERKEDWAQTEYRQWKIGHFHKKKQTSYVAGDTFTGVEVVVSPSLCGADAWHHSKGYVKNVKSAVANLWGYENGLIGNLQYNHLE